MPHTPEPENNEVPTTEVVDPAAICSADLLERADDMLARAHIMLDGWPQAVKWHHDYERLKKQPTHFHDCTGVTNGVGKITAPQRIG